MSSLRPLALPGLVVLVVALVVWHFYTSPMVPPPAMAGATTAPETTSASAAPRAALAPPDVAERPVRPFTGPSAFLLAGEHESGRSWKLDIDAISHARDLTLEGIMFDVRRPQAMLSGRTVIEGSVFEHAGRTVKVVEIAPDRVVLQIGTGRARCELLDIFAAGRGSSDGLRSTAEPRGERR